MSAFEAVGDLNRHLGLDSDVTDEHSRWATYQVAIGRLKDAADSVEPLLGAALAAEPQTTLATSVVLMILEQIPAEAHQAWIDLLPADDRPYVLSRSEDVATLRKLVSEAAPLAAEPAVDGWSDWLQIRAAKQSVHRSALQRLAADGRTRRIRHTASERLRRAASELV